MKNTTFNLIKIEVGKSTINDLTRNMDLFNKKDKEDLLDEIINDFKGMPSIQKHIEIKKQNL